MNLDDIREILALMREHGLSEFEIEREGLRLKVRKDSPVAAAAPSGLSPGGVLPSVVSGVAGVAGSAGAAGPPAAAGAASGPDAQTLEAPEAEIELAVVKSPIVGTFYRSSEPSAASFVEIGTTVKKGEVLCIIEAMKLMNEIDSEYDGEIVNIYVENGQPVQYGERLFAIRTA